MAKKSPAFQMYPADWLGSLDIMTMTPAEEGAYFRLLCIAWLQDDCGLPDDDSILAHLSRLGDGWLGAPDSSAIAVPSSAISSAIKIRKKFVSENGRLYNARLLAEREKQEQNRQDKSDAGRKGAAKRWKQKSKTRSRRSNSSAMAEPKQSHGDAMILPMAKNSSSSSISSSNNPLYIPPVNGSILSAEDMDPKPELDRIFGLIRAEHPKGKCANAKKAREQFNGQVNQKPKAKISWANKILTRHREWQPSWEAGRFAPDLARWIRDFDEDGEAPPIEKPQARAGRPTTAELNEAWAAKQLEGS